MTATRALLMLMTLGLSACGGDKGDATDGADGGDGSDGADGSDGTDGTDGTDGGDGADGACRVERQRLAVNLFGLQPDFLHQLHIRPVVTLFGGDGEQPRCARIHRLVQRVADAGNDFFAGAKACDDAGSQLVEVGINRRIGQGFLQHAGRRFHAADEYAAQAAQSGGDGGLHGFRGAGISHACGN